MHVQLIFLSDLIYHLIFKGYNLQSAEFINWLGLICCICTSIDYFLKENNEKWSW